MMPLKERQVLTLAKPDWLKTKFHPQATEEVQALLSSLSLNTICSSAACPNMGECFNNHTATFMILGENCTRNCRFCNVSKQAVSAIDPHEPENLAKASRVLGLKHIVVTSVTRDDLPDGGASQFVKTIQALHNTLPDSTVEVLIPDFQGNIEALKMVLDAKPDILNHNIETVPALYANVRPMADYRQSLAVLKNAKDYAPDISTKSGIMVGLGETPDQVAQVMDDLREAGCDVLTIGQYLRPSPQHIAVAEYIKPKQFEAYQDLAYQKGFKYVASGPFVRSSYHALEGMKALKGDT